MQRLTAAGITVSLFIDPQQAQIEAAKDVGARCIELHTGKYANAREQTDALQEFENLKKSAGNASNLGLQVFAGHGLDYQNVKKILSIAKIEELNIGHSIISRAVFVGLEAAVCEMIDLITRSSIGLRPVR